MTEVGFEDDFPPHNFLKGLAILFRKTEVFLTALPPGGPGEAFKTPTAWRASLYLQTTTLSEGK